MKNTMTATRLRAILLVCMIGIILIGAGGFVFAHKQLTEYAATISKLNADAATGDQNIQTLLSLEEKLDAREDAIQRASSVVADKTNFANVAIDDITRIASESGVTLSSYEFVASGATGAEGTTTPTTPAAPATATTPESTSQPTATTPSGVTQKSISVTLESPLPYANLMKFIQGIESNSLRMQISTLSMTKDQGDSVTTQPFTIKVNVKQ